MNTINNKLNELSNPGITNGAMDLNFDTNTKQHKSEMNKTTRKVPIILKNNSKQQKAYSINVDTQQGMKISESLSIKDTHKHKKTATRKQKLSAVDKSHCSHDWNICSFNQKEKVLDKHLESIKRTRKEIKKQETYSAINKSDSLSSKLNNNTSVNLNCEFQTLSPFQGIESREAQEMIDFSSNEIFNKYNYEFYYNSGDTSCATNSDEICDSLSVAHSIYEETYNVNGNKAEFEENKEGERKDSTSKSSIDEYLNENWDEDLSFCNNNTRSSCLDDGCCNYCLQDCVSNWITTSEIKKLQVHEVVVDDNEENDDSSLLCAVKPMEGSTDRLIANNTEQDDLNDCYFYTVEPIEHLVDDKLIESNDGQNDLNDSCFYAVEPVENSFNTSEQCNASDICDNNISEQLDASITIGTNSSGTDCCLQHDIDSTLAEFINCLKEETVDEEILYETEQDCNTLSDSSTDTDYETLEKYTAQDETNDLQDAEKTEFQCSKCRLAFWSARTLAMHQAGAHAGMYVILCESCGTRFNRKNHFNRHLVYCRHKKSFKCSICTRLYRHKSSLVNHLKAKHDVNFPSTRSKFVCNICGKVYRRFGTFVNHLKSH